MTKQPDTPSLSKPAPAGSAQSSTPSRAPFFQATQAARYQRQGLIKTIQEKTGTHLICYVAGSQTAIDRDDTVGFVDLMHHIPRESAVDLLLHTGGGDIDAAEKLISMVRTKVGTEVLRIIVPDYAKSAGTLMALGADELIMSDTSELGPIDPQITLSDGNGNRIRHSIQSYLDAHESLCETLRKNPDDVPSKVLLQKLDPATVKLFEAVRHRAKNFAEQQLKRGMFRNNSGNYTATVAELLDTKRWQSHAQMISWQDAQDPKIGLSVRYLEPASQEWRDYWQLYCLQRLGIGEKQKLFESDSVSLTVDD